MIDDSVPPAREHAVTIRGFRQRASLLAVAIPIAMMAIGLVMAVLSAGAAQRDAAEGIGTFGVEFGAALWFAGGVTLGARPAPFRRRALLFGLLTIGGLGLIAISLLRSWTGAPLALAMEFGVGALAIVVIDTVLLNQVQRRLHDASGVERATVKIRVDGVVPSIRVDAAPLDTGSG